MKFNKWTLGLAAVGAVSMASAVRADDAPKLSALNTALSSTTISGYVDVAAQYNAGDPGGKISPTGAGYTGAVNQPGYSFNNSGKVDNFSLNNVTVSLDKPEDDSPWASGYHIDINAGSDAITPLNSASSSGGVSTSISTVGIRQAYIALRTPVGNGIDWKVGLFDGITGYEVNTAYLNPNYTRSYGYTVNPASELGLLGTYKINNIVSVVAGYANRYPNNGGAVGLSSHDVIGSVALTAPDSWGWFKGSALNLQTIQGFDNGSVNNYSVNGTFNTPIANLAVGLAYDKLQGLGYNEGGDGNIYGVYVTYQATDKLKFAARGEYLDGQNLGFLLNNTTGSGTPASGKGEEVTFTVEYDLWANVTSRLEARWDHVESGTAFNNGSGQVAGGNPASTENSILIALNLVYKF
jgi:hypothetical protein